MYLCTRCLGTGTTPSAAQAGGALLALGLLAGAAAVAWPLALFAPAALAFAALSPAACARCKATRLVPLDSPAAQRLLAGR